MEPTEHVDIDRFDDWLDHLARDIASPAPDDATELAATAQWLHEKGHKIMMSPDFSPQFQEHPRPVPADGPASALPITGLRPPARSSLRETPALSNRLLMAAAAVLLIAVLVGLLLFRSLGSAPDVPTIPAPMNGLAQAGTPVACSVQQPSVLTISGTPENEALLQQNTFVSNPGHPGDRAVAIVEQDLPTGPAASKDDLADIQHVLATLAACIHAGDFVSADALYSDDSFRRAGVNRDIREQATPTTLPLPTEIVTAVILSSNVLPDGRVGVLIEQDLWGFGQQEYYILVNSERGWLVDEVSLVVPNASIASPVASTAIKIIASDLTFTPGTLVIPADTEVTLTIINEGVVPHSFAISEFDIVVRLEPGQSEDLTLNLPPGTYVFKSTVANQGAFMQGTLVAV